MTRLATALLALLPLLPGCGRGEAASPRPVVFSYPGSTQANRDYGEAVRRFREVHPEIPVRLMPITGADHYGKLLVLMAAKESPDLVWMGQGFGEFAERGVFLDLEEWVRAEPALRPGAVLPEVVDWYRAKGKLQGYPFGVDMDFIAYNEALFDQAGLPYPPDEWTMAEFVETARRLTRDADADGKPEVWGFRGPIGFEPWGASLLTPDRRRANVDTPQMVTALDFHRNLFTRWRVAPPMSTPEIDRQDAILGFQAGQAAMIYAYTFQLPDLRSKLAGRRWDIAPIPRGTTYLHWASSQGFSIPRDARRPRDAWTLLRFLLTSDALLSLGRRCYPVHRRLATRVLAENRERPYRLDVLKRALPHLQAYPRVPNLTELLADYFDACQRVYEGRATPQAGMNAAARSMDDILARRH